MGLYTCMYIYVYMWQRLKSIGLVTGPGGLFATRLVSNRIGGSCDKPSLRQAYCRLQYSTHRPATEGGGTATNPYFESQRYIYTYIYIQY